MSVGEVILDEFEWEAYGTCAGPGSPELPGRLLKFINSESPDEARLTWLTIENVAFAQNTIYESAEPVVEVLVAALSDERPEWTQMWILELLRFILIGGNPEDPTLIERCYERARRAIWLLASLAHSVTKDNRETVLEVLDLIDPERAQLVRTGSG